MNCRDCGDPNCIGYLYKYFGEPIALTYLGTCLNCDAITHNDVHVEDPDMPGGEVWCHICPPCFKLAVDRMKDFDRQFKFLVQNGMHPGKAHKAIEKRIDELVLRAG